MLELRLGLNASHVLQSLRGTRDESRKDLAKNHGEVQTLNASASMPMVTELTAASLGVINSTVLFSSSAASVASAGSVTIHTGGQNR